jgi:hypothetical protein
LGPKPPSGALDPPPASDAGPETTLWHIFCGDDAEAPPDPHDTIAAELWRDLVHSIDELGAEKTDQLRAVAAAADAGQKTAGATASLDFCAAMLKLACDGGEWRPLYYAACKICALAAQRRERDRPPGAEPGDTAKIDPRKPRAGRPARYERLDDLFESAG